MEDADKAVEGSYLLVKINDKGSAEVEVRLHKKEPPELVGLLLANLHLQAALVFRDHDGIPFGEAVSRISRAQGNLLAQMVREYLEPASKGLLN